MIKVTKYYYLDKTYEDEYYTEEDFLERWWNPMSSNGWILTSSAIGIKGKLLVLACNKFSHLTNL